MVKEMNYLIILSQALKVWLKLEKIANVLVLSCLLISLLLRALHGFLEIPSLQNIIQFMIVTMTE
jgi:hypothetical protein